MTEQNRLPSCRTAHDWVVSSICIVVHHRPVKRAWAFQIETVHLGLGASEPQGAPLAGMVGGDAQSVHPVGNTGYLQRKNKFSRQTS